MHGQLHLCLQMCTSVHGLGGVGMRAAVCLGSCGPAFSACVQVGNLTTLSLKLLSFSHPPWVHELSLHLGQLSSGQTFVLYLGRGEIKS